MEKEEVVEMLEDLCTQHAENEVGLVTSTEVHIGENEFYLTLADKRFLIRVEDV